MFIKFVDTLILMLDIDFERDMTPLFFKDVMQYGVIAASSRLPPEVRA